jgi:hypothetical protein
MGGANEFNSVGYGGCIGGIVEDLQAGLSTMVRKGEIRLKGHFHATTGPVAICCCIIEVVEYFKDSLFEDI